MSACQVFQGADKGRKLCTSCGRARLLHKFKSAWRACAVCYRHFQRTDAATVACSDSCAKLLGPRVVRVERAA